MSALSALLWLATSSTASAGIIIGNFGADSTVVHLEAETVLPPHQAQVIEGVTVHACDQSPSWSVPMQHPVHVRDATTFVVPGHDWCAVDFDLGPHVEPVDLDPDGELMVGAFSTPPTAWDVAVGPADALFDF